MVSAVVIVVYHVLFLNTASTKSSGVYYGFVLSVCLGATIMMLILFEPIQE